MSESAVANRRIIASSRKYDLLTAIALGGLTGALMRETLALRLIALITARYDWARDSVTVGQEELQRLWSVSRRTVIRDIAELRRLGVLVLVEAGRRGRVARYRLGHATLDAALAPASLNAGNALEQRLTATPELKSAVSSIEESSPDTCWSAVRDVVAVEIGAAAAARWLQPLRSEGRSCNALRLTAPSPFHADYVGRIHGGRLDNAASALGYARRVVVTSR